MSRSAGGAFFLRGFSGCGVLQEGTGGKWPPIKKKGQIMKNKISLLTMAAATLLVSAASPIKAQTVGEDGIAASPRVRQILNERRASNDAACTYPEVSSFRDAGYRAIGDDGIAASPKMRAMLNEH